MRIFKILPIIIAGVLSCTSDQKQTAPPPSPPTAVDVIVAAPILLSDVVECNGSVVASESVELHVETAGRLVSIYPNDGATVRSGTLLAKVNDAELQAQLRQQTVQLDLARKQKTRLEQLVAVNGVNQSDYDDAVNKVAVLEASIEMTKAQIEKTEVRARFDGTLGIRTVSPGAYVTPQTMLGTLQEKGTLKIDFTIPEQYRDVLRTGMTLRILQSGGNKDSATATLSAIDPQVNPETRNLRCRAKLTSGKTMPGAFVKVLVPRSTNCIAVPSQCIIPDAVSDKVLVVKEGKGLFANVRTGARTRGYVQLVEGISEGDTVIATGVLFVRPKSPVKVRSVIQPELPSSGKGVD
ncbi:MAG: efflux RND transporter periplasmic adaptor subunit [Bacteroidota bacterium]